jgi:hypothetical protein
MVDIRRLGVWALDRKCPDMLAGFGDRGAEEPLRLIAAAAPQQHAPGLSDDLGEALARQFLERRISINDPLLARNGGDDEGDGT